MNPDWKIAWSIFIAGCIAEHTERQPSRRVYIEKEDGRQRPLGVAALEDKIVQHAVVTILNQIYEEDFLGFSYGFRPGRSQHQALDALSYALLKKKVNYVLDADIRGFFDNLDNRWLIKFVEHRVADPRILRLIQKWLNAGVMEEGKWSETQTGSPQGSVISPLLANIYLHYAFDLWVNVWRKKYAQGEVVVSPLCGHHLGIPASDGSRSFSGKLTGATGEVWAGTPSRQDAPD
jgi:RNA-directed DNA polymerase